MLQPLYEVAFKMKYDSCAVASIESTEKLPGGQKSPVKMNLQSSAENKTDGQATVCLKIRSCINDEQVQQCKSSTSSGKVLWYAEHCSIVVEVAGLFEKNETDENTDNHPKIRELKETLKLIIYDLCKFAANCFSGSEVTELRVEMPKKMALDLFCSQLAPRSKSLCEFFLSCGFAFTHFARVPGVSDVLGNFAPDDGCVLGEVNFDDHKNRRLILLRYQPRSTEFKDTFFKLLNSTEESAFQSFFCIMYNELDLLKWYTKEKTIENQRHRLPNHDSSLVAIDFQDNTLQFCITAFDQQDMSRYSKLKSTTEVPEEYKDDEFLATIKKLCREASRKSAKHFSVECLFVPCRTTLYVLHQMSSELDTEECVASALPSASQTEVSAPQPEIDAADQRQDTSVQSNDANILLEIEEAIKSNDDRYLQQLSKLQSLNDKDYCATELCDLLLTALEEGIEFSNPLIQNMPPWFWQEPVCGGLPALELAIQEFGSLDTVQLLLEKQSFLLFGEDRSQYKRLSDFYWMAWKLDRKEIYSFIHSKTFGQNPPEKFAAKLREMDCLFISGNKADFNDKLKSEPEICNYRDWEGRILLMLVAMGNDYLPNNGIKFFKLVLEQSGDLLNAMDFKGATALHLAARAGNSDAASELLKAGASTSAKNFDGDTPLDVAKKTGEEEVAELLRNFEEEVAELLKKKKKEKFAELLGNFKSEVTEEK